MQRRKRRRRRPSIPSILAIVGTVALIIVIFNFLPFGFFKDVGSTALNMTGTTEPSATPSDIVAAAQTPVPTEEPLKGVETLRVATIGDVMNHEAIYKAAKTGDSYDFKPFFEIIKPYLMDADMTFANQEFPVRPDRDVKGYPRFNAPVEYLEAIKDAGIDYVSLANNHILDTYVDGAIATMQNVTQQGLVYAGTALSQQEFDTTVMITRGEIKIAFLSYTTSTNGMEKDVDQEKLPYTVRYFDEDKIIADIGKAKDEGADVVLLSLHWGKEYETTPTSTQVTQAKKFCEAGADVIMGSHPHVLQPMEKITVQRADGAHEALIIYSMANFISNQRDDTQDTGAIFYFNIEKDHDNSGKISITSVEYLPVWVWRYDDANDNQTFRVVPAGSYGDNPPAEMGSSAAKRVKEAWEESTGLLGQSVGTPLKG